MPIFAIFENTGKYAVFCQRKVNALLLINNKQAWGQVFELGRGKNYSIKDIADMFSQEVEYKDNKPGEAEITLCTDTLAKELSGLNILT